MVIKLTQWTTAILLALFMMFTVQQLAPVFADDTMNDVPYTKYSWDGTKVVDSTEYADNVKVIPADGSMTEGWYYLNSNVTVKHRISLTGDTNLILGNGVTLDVRGIYIPYGSILSIYAQSKGSNAGTINSHPSEGAAIGATSDNHPGGSVEIHGGNIIAKGAGNCA